MVNDMKENVGKRMLEACVHLAAALTLLGAAGCGGPGTPSGHFELVIGSRGHTAGKFNRPRGITYYAPEKTIFVVDWDGRIQKFTTNGQFRASWIMPKIEKGKPEDLCIAKNGNLLVADTHYSRITEFTRDGRLVRTFGRYGRNPGEFIYPVGICCDNEGNIYVSEYGENDRIQKFDADGRFILSWGKFGTADGEFQRPSGIDITTNNTIFVADAVNHRVQVFDTQGTLLRIIGKEGAGRGEFRYPYDVVIGNDAFYVLEYGNQRVQKMTLDGQPLELLGQPGSGDGRFASPWRCAVIEDSLFVSDTENNRVVKLGATF
jgi:DNA-binding beta-propeller fold protein YncE